MLPATCPNAGDVSRSTQVAFDGSGNRTSLPEWEYEYYRKRYRPVYELLRSWCGHRSVTFVERLTAAESEVRRLDILVATLVDAFGKHDINGAGIYERKHNEERVVGQFEIDRAGSVAGGSGSVGFTELCRSTAWGPARPLRSAWRRVQLPSC
jgi:hypothetical protein